MDSNMDRRKFMAAVIGATLCPDITTETIKVISPKEIDWNVMFNLTLNNYKKDLIDGILTASNPFLSYSVSTKNF